MIITGKSILEIKNVLDNKIYIESIFCIVNRSGLEYTLDIPIYSIADEEDFS